MTQDLNFHVNTNTECSIYNTPESFHSTLDPATNESCIYRWPNFSSIIANINETIFDPTENYEILLGGLSISLQKSHWLVKKVKSQTCVDSGALLTEILNTKVSFLLFSDEHLECSNCPLTVDLSEVVQKLKHIFEKFLSHRANANGSFNLNLLVNKSTIYMIDIIIKNDHDCSNIANMNILGMGVKRFIRVLNNAVLKTNLVVDSPDVLRLKLYGDTSDTNDDYINNIIKDIRKRRVKLTCVLCWSTVRNMTDHLLKTHIITDRNERKTWIEHMTLHYLNNKIHMRTANDESVEASMETTTSRKLRWSRVDKRKRVNCSECKSKYLVNISDHLIKTHHMKTRASRKQILTKIHLGRKFHSSDQTEG